MCRSAISIPFRHQTIHLPELERVEGIGGRFYVSPDGEHLPSVTTILGDTERKEWLHEWIERVGAERAAEISKAAANRGSYVHSMVESYLKNTELAKGDHPPSYWWMFQRIRKMLDRINDVRVLEGTVFSKAYKYGGRMDCCAKFDGKLSIIDFKTYSRPKTIDQLETAFIQCCMYGIALEEEVKMLFDEDIKIEQLVVIFSSETDMSEAVVQPREKYQALALARVARYHAMRSA